MKHKRTNNEQLIWAKHVCEIALGELEGSPVHK